MVHYIYPICDACAAGPSLASGIVALAVESALSRWSTLAVELVSPKGLVRTVEASGVSFCLQLLSLGVGGLCVQHM